MNGFSYKCLQVSVPAIMLSVLMFSSLALAADVDQATEKREQAASIVAKEFLTTLGGQLKKSMQTDGPVASISVCKEIAPQVAAELSLKNGWRVTRVSSQPRNALLGTPDAWESRILADFLARAEKGEKYSDMTHSEVVEEDGKSYFRFMKPLAIKPVCLTCHGSDDTVPAAIQAELEKSYPFDKARGYQAGELRGAVSIKQPMDSPLRKHF